MNRSNLAPRFDSLKGSASPHISQGQLFRVEAVLALIAIVLVAEASVDDS